MANILYSWTFNDAKHRPAMWYAFAFAVVAGLAVWGVLTRQYGLSFVIILVSGVVFFIENNAPKKVEVKVSDLGIQILQEFYEYEKIESYSFIYKQDEPRVLRLQLQKKGITLFINLGIDANIYRDLKGILPNYLRYDEDTELSRMDKIIDFLKL